MQDEVNSAIIADALAMAYANVFESPLRTFSIICLISFRLTGSGLAMKRPQTSRMTWASSYSSSLIISAIF